MCMDTLFVQDVATAEAVDITGCEQPTSTLTSTNALETEVNVYNYAYGKDLITKGL